MPGKRKNPPPQAPKEIEKILDIGKGWQHESDDESEEKNRDEEIRANRPKFKNSTLIPFEKSLAALPANHTPTQRIMNFLATSVLRQRYGIHKQPYKYSPPEKPLGQGGEFMGNIFHRLTQRRGSNPYLLRAYGPRGQDNVHPDIWTEAMFQEALTKKYPKILEMEGYAPVLPRHEKMPINPQIIGQISNNREIINEWSPGRPYYSAFYSEIEPCNAAHGQNCQENIRSFLGPNDFGWHSIPYDKQFPNAVKAKENAYGDVASYLGRDAVYGRQPIPPMQSPKHPSVVDAIERIRMAGIERTRINREAAQAKQAAKKAKLELEQPTPLEQPKPNEANPDEFPHKRGGYIRKNGRASVKRPY